MTDYRQRAAEIVAQAERDRRTLAGDPYVSPTVTVAAPAEPPGAAKVEGFPRPARWTKYPFAEIARDGGVWKLDPAVYEVKAGSIRSAADKYARNHGLRLLAMEEGGCTYVQFTKREP